MLLNIRHYSDSLLLYLCYMLASHTKPKEANTLDLNRRRVCCFLLAVQLCLCSVRLSEDDDDDVSALRVNINYSIHTHGYNSLAMCLNCVCLLFAARQAACLWFIRAKKKKKTICLQHLEIGCTDMN